MNENSALDLIITTYAMSVNCNDCPWCRTCSVPYDDVIHDKETFTGCVVALKSYIKQAEEKNSSKPLDNSSTM